MKVVNHAPARRGVVDAGLPVVDEKATVGRPEVLQEESQLDFRQTRHLGGDELFVAPLTVEAEAVEPESDRVAPSPGQAEGRRQVQVPRVLLGDPARHDTEVPRGLIDRIEIRRIGARVMDGLAGNETAVAKQVSEKNDSGLRPFDAAARLRDPARRRQPVAGREPLEGAPALQG